MNDSPSDCVCTVGASGGRRGRFMGDEECDREKCCCDLRQHYWVRWRSSFRASEMAQLVGFGKIEV